MKRDNIDGEFQVEFMVEEDTESVDGKGKKKRKLNIFLWVWVWVFVCVSQTTYAFKHSE